MMRNAILLIFVLTTPSWPKPMSEDQIVIVRAVVQKVQGTDPKQIITATLSIQNVYRGQADLVGRTFTAYSVPEESAGTSVFPPPRLGEVGIWTLKRTEGGEIHHVKYPLRGVFPARKGVTPRYDEAEQLAEAIAKADQQAAEDRPAAFLDQVRSPTPEVAAWAVRELATVDPGAIRRLTAEPSAIDAISVAGQTTLDEVAAAILGAAWRDSPQRLQMLKRWVYRDQGQFDQIAIVDRLDLIAQHLDLELDTLGTLLRDMAARPGTTEETRRRIQFILDHRRQFPH